MKNKDIAIREKIKEILSINKQKKELTETWIEEMGKTIQGEVDSYVINQVILSKQLKLLAEEVENLL